MTASLFPCPRSTNTSGGSEDSHQAASLCEASAQARHFTVQNCAGSQAILCPSMFLVGQLSYLTWVHGMHWLSGDNKHLGKASHRLQ